MKNMKRIQWLYWTQYGGLEKAWSSSPEALPPSVRLRYISYPVLGNEYTLSAFSSSDMHIVYCTEGEHEYEQ